MGSETVIILNNSYLSRFRAKAFWGLESISDGAIITAYSNIKEIDSLESISPMVEDYKNSVLSKLIQHARKTTTYYAKLENRSSEINSFPVINKSIIRKNQEDFFSRSVNRKSLIVMATSGTSGTPFLCYQDIGKRKRVLAELIYYGRKCGYILGNNIIFLRALTEKTRKHRFLQLIQNETLIDIGNLGDENISIILNKVARVSNINGSVLYLNASTLDAFKDYFKSNSITKMQNINLNSIISNGEMLFDETRKMMIDIFECPCFSRYSNQENGVIGQDSPDRKNDFTLNEASYLIEILKMDSDEVADEGEVGRVIITDYYNYAMPLIRYDTGDIGSLIYSDQGGIKKRILTNFSGRKNDLVYDCDGNRLSPHLISNTLWSFPEVSQYQFIQENTNGYLVILVVDENFYRIDEIKYLIKKIVGDNSTVTVCISNCIPRLKSGKRKYIINNMK